MPELIDEVTTLLYEFGDSFNRNTNPFFRKVLTKKFAERLDLLFRPVAPPPTENDILGIEEHVVEDDYTKYIPKSVQKRLGNKRNIMIHGAAGTGKSTVLKAIATLHKNSIVLSPTGIAAVNVGGQTIHSFFKFSLGYLSRNEVTGLPANKKLLKTKPLLIIDEVSMVRSDLFDAMDLALKLTLGNSEPFGGLQLVLIGDTGQLPPVVTNDEKQLFKAVGDEMFFASRAFLKAAVRTVELKTVHRQNDTDFISFLMKVRNNTVRRADIEWFNSKITVLSNSDYFESEKNKPDSTILCMTNRDAQWYNDMVYVRLDSVERCYSAVVTGKFSDKEYPTDEKLKLKVGAKVVMLRNSSEGSYVNGSVGIVTRLESDHVYVELKGVETKIVPAKWEKFTYTSTETGVEKTVTGKFEQLPMRLAWAITVHKSQGMTLSGMHLNLDTRPFAHGQTYVALSRARDIQGITASRPLLKSDIIHNEMYFMEEEQ